MSHLLFSIEFLTFLKNGLFGFLQFQFAGINDSQKSTLERFFKFSLEKLRGTTNDGFK